MKVVNSHKKAILFSGGNGLFQILFDIGIEKPGICVGSSIPPIGGHAASE
jgi:hypothetical protein